MQAPKSGEGGHAAKVGGGGTCRPQSRGGMHTPKSGEGGGCRSMPPAPLLVHTHAFMRARICANGGAGGRRYVRLVHVHALLLLCPCPPIPSRSDSPCVAVSGAASFGIEDLTGAYNSGAGQCPLQPRSPPVRVVRASASAVTLEFSQNFQTKTVSQIATNCIDPSDPTHRDGDPTGADPRVPTCGSCCPKRSGVKADSIWRRNCSCEGGFATVAVYVRDAQIGAGYGPLDYPVPDHCGLSKDAGSKCRLVYRVPCGGMSRCPLPHAWNESCVYWDSVKIVIRGALWELCEGPPLGTTNRQQPPTPHQPAATNRQLPTATNHQSPTANRRQPPPTATNRQLPTANRQPPVAGRHQPWLKI